MLLRFNKAVGRYGQGQSSEKFQDQSAQRFENSTLIGCFFFGSFWSTCKVFFTIKFYLTWFDYEWKICIDFFLTLNGFLWVCFFFFFFFRVMCIYRCPSLNCHWFSFNCYILSSTPVWYCFGLFTKNIIIK